MMVIGTFFGFLALGFTHPESAFKGNKLRPEARIVGGHGAYIEDFPYMVSVRSFIAGFVEDHICGGSIISEEWVLTAASCSSQYSVKELRVRVGDSDSEEGKIYEVSSVIAHANYSGGTSPANDISLVKVKTPFVFNTTVQAVKLASANTEVAAGTEATLPGWGTVEIGGLPLQYLRQLKMPVLSSKDCAKDYSTALDVDSMFCAGYEQDGKGPCQGDQGGPLVVNSTQLGLLSWGIQCGATNHPGVYTKISHYRDWITAQTGV